MGAWNCLLGAWICLLGAWTSLLGAWTSLLGAWTCLLGDKTPDSIGPGTVRPHVDPRIESQSENSL